ncbi:MAG: sulfite oxidase heme-binding subunit YedZ [Burkholderiaceae bacterium]
MTLYAARLIHLKRAVFVVALLPLITYLWLAIHQALGANPIEALTRASGDWTLYFLCLTLAMTPLRRITKQNWLQALRRMLGLFTFFYACLHLITFIWFDHFFDTVEIWRDVWKRPFITVGFAAFLLLIPLAVTSTHAMQRRLGRHWSRLHRLVYAVALLALLHFWWMRSGKQNFGEPLLLTVIILILLTARVASATQRWIQVRTSLADSRGAESR